MQYIPEIRIIQLIALFQVRWQWIRFHQLNDRLHKILCEYILQYDLMILHYFSIACFDENAQQVNYFAEPQIHFAGFEDCINALAEVFQLLIVANDQLPIVSINLFDNIHCNIVMRGF